MLSSPSRGPRALSPPPPPPPRRALASCAGTRQPWLSEGKARFEVKVNVLSSHRNMQKFRFRVFPADAAVRRDFPALKCETGSVKTLSKMPRRKALGTDAASRAARKAEEARRQEEENLKQLVSKLGSSGDLLGGDVGRGGDGGFGAAAAAGGLGGRLPGGKAAASSCGGGAAVAAPAPAAGPVRLTGPEQGQLAGARGGTTVTAGGAAAGGPAGAGAVLVGQAGELGAAGYVMSSATHEEMNRRLEEQDREIRKLTEANNAILRELKALREAAGAQQEQSKH